LYHEKKTNGFLKVTEKKKKESITFKTVFDLQSFNNNNLDSGPVPHFCPLEALQQVWLTPEVYCTILRISNRSYFGRQVPLVSTTRGSAPRSHRRNYGWK
jgi:hypothetical protein